MQNSHNSGLKLSDVQNMLVGFRKEDKLLMCQSEMFNMTAEDFLKQLASPSFSSEGSNDANDGSAHQVWHSHQAQKPPWKTERPS